MKAWLRVNHPDKDRDRPDADERTQAMIHLVAMFEKAVKEEGGRRANTWLQARMAQDAVREEQDIQEKAAADAAEALSRSLHTVCCR